MDEIRGNSRRFPWALGVVGLGMFGMVAFFIWQRDWFGVAINIAGGVAVTGYVAYRLRRP
jgi:hypothetical protein